MTGFKHGQKNGEEYQDSNQITREGMLSKAIMCHIQGDLKEAEKAYRTALNEGALNLELFINLGTIYQRSNRKEEAESMYKQAIKINAFHPDAYTNLGGLYMELGYYDKALQLTLKSLEINRKNDNALANLGEIYRRMGDIDQAISSTQESLELNPDNPDTLMNLGHMFKDLGRLDQALSHTLRSLEIKPDSYQALTLLGGIYSELDSLDKALDSTLESLALEPERPAAHLNLSSIYLKLGNLDKALDSTLELLALEPERPAALTNLGMIYEAKHQLNNALKSYIECAKLINKYSEESCLTSLIHASTILLESNKIDEAKRAIKTSLEIGRTTQDVLKLSCTKTKKNNHAYLIFLEKLVDEIPTADTLAMPTVLHLGESHCLAFTNQVAQIKGKKCIIKPSLVRGAKAYHLSEKSQQNIQKISFQNRTKKDLDYFEYIFLSFGEIDCRADEGILSYCQKHGKSIHESADATARQYFEWSATSLVKYKKKLIYFGTPAPYRSEKDNPITAKKDEERLMTVRSFNEALKEQCIKFDILFADVYKLTAGIDGYNSDKWMIDSIHLKPTALSRLMQYL